MCQSANVPIFQLGVPTVPRRAKILTWLANVPKGVPFFQIVFKRIMFFHIPNKFLPNTFYIFLYFKYIPNIYFLYEYIFLPNFIHRV